MLLGLPCSRALWGRLALRYDWGAVFLYQLVSVSMMHCLYSCASSWIRYFQIIFTLRYLMIYCSTSSICLCLMMGVNRREVFFFFIIWFLDAEVTMKIISCIFDVHVVWMMSILLERWAKKSRAAGSTTGSNLN